MPALVATFAHFFISDLLVEAVSNQEIFSIKKGKKAPIWLPFCLNAISKTDYGLKVKLPVMVVVLSEVVRLMVVLVAVAEMTPALLVTAIVPELGIEFQTLAPKDTEMATAMLSVVLKSDKKGMML